jgi:hypothetical protein
MASFRGTYFYGDWCAGTVSSLVQSGGVATNLRDWTPQLGSDLGFSLTGFGTDAQGELYITDGDGLVYAVVPPAARHGGRRHRQRRPLPSREVGDLDLGGSPHGELADRDRVSGLPGEPDRRPIQRG